MIKKITLILAILLVGFGISVIPVQSGILLTDGEENPLLFLPWDSDKLTIGWRHSVELTPWKETYRIIENGNLSLESTLYKSYGAGTPDTDGKVEFLPNGFIQVTGIDRVIPHYSLFYVAISNYYLANNEQRYPLSDYVPEDINIQIHYEQIQVYKWLLLRIFNKEVSLR
ncbi:DUF1850 domain-containing protein [Oceanobacillus sp. FSL W7-1309]|uniref:DUF1850 domain-containing protein n=1 Tax=Oceanobacillus sp. FSL W7-1309 TaxID=2954539 RepID=UPI0030F7C72B